MRRALLALPSPFVALLLACEAAPPPAAASSPAIAAGESAEVATPSKRGETANANPVQKMGAPITVTDTVALATIAARPARFAQKTVRTEGTVKAVCQSAGCWMELSDGEGRAHIKMAGHKFFVPKDASGRHAVVQALVLGSPDDGECEQEAEQATGRPVELSLVATGVELM